MDGSEVSFSFRSTDGQHWWDAVFATANSQPLTPGEYLGVVRYPFGDATHASMDLYGDGRGSNQVGGWFKVLEISFTPTGQVQSAAIDFYHLSENIADRWTLGSLRFNSEIALSPVPEPSTTLLGMSPIIGLFLRRRR